MKAPALVAIARDLRQDLERLRFAAPVTHVYDPLVYAWAPHQLYLERYGGGPKQVVMFGMNPGPFGMAQTGVPFGEVSAVRDWLGIEARVNKPAIEHPARPVLGFACPRSEVSGARLWGFIRERFGTPERFFRDFFIANYCPLAFMEESGRNRTPDKLPAAERDALLGPCDRAIRRVVEELEPKLVVGIGGFAEDAARRALAGLPIAIGRILHPSPASPLANKGWAEEATRTLRALGAPI